MILTRDSTYRLTRRMCTRSSSRARSASSHLATVWNSTSHRQYPTGPPEFL